MTPVRLAIFASGSGSNAENIIRYFASEPKVEIGLVLSNNPEAQVHLRARMLGVPSYTLTKDVLVDGAELNHFLKEKGIDFIVLAGYLVKVPAELVATYRNRIVNIHPALLPKFGGKGMYGLRVHEAVVAAGEVESGITIHLIDEHYDEGSIVFQAKCPVFPGDTPAQVADNVHSLEYEYYPKQIHKILQKEFNW